MDAPTTFLCQLGAVGSVRLGTGRPPVIGSAVADRRRPAFSKDTELRVVMGLCDYRLTEESRRQAVRRLGRRLLLDAPPRWDEVLRAAELEFA